MTCFWFFFSANAVDVVVVLVVVAFAVAVVGEAQKHRSSFRYIRINTYTVAVPHNHHGFYSHSLLFYLSINPCFLFVYVYHLAIINVYSKHFMSPSVPMHARMQWLTKGKITCYEFIDYEKNVMFNFVLNNKLITLDCRLSLFTIRALRLNAELKSFN